MSEGTPTTPATPEPAPVISLDPTTLFDQVAAKRIGATIKGGILGITPEMLRRHLNRKAPVTADELRSVTESLAREILYRQFWLPLGGDKYPDLAAAVFDVAVRRGHADEGIKIIQTAIPMVESVVLKKDGRLGNQTLTAIESLKKAGKDIALLERIDGARRTVKFRLFDGKLFGHDIDSAGAASLVMRAIIAAKTGRLI